MQGWLHNLGKMFRFDGLFWRRLAYLGCVYGPEWWKRYSPPWFGWAIFLFVERNRRAVTANMARVLGIEGWAARVAALRLYAEFAHCYTETMEFYGPRPRPIRFEVHGRDLLFEARAAGRGMVLVTGHIGNWDIAAKALREHCGSINVVTAVEANATVQEDIRRGREAAGVRMIYSNRSVVSSIDMIRALKANEIVAMQIDRMTSASGTRWLSFFGSLAPFPAGPFVLARLAGAPIFAVFVPRIGVRHYAVHIKGPFFFPASCVIPTRSIA